MNTPANLKYAASHEWAKLESDGTVTIGITDHAQGALGDIVFLELPDVGRVVKAGEECAVVESVKAASDIYSPVSGEVVAANTAAVDAPESVNADAYANWLFRVKPSNPERTRRPAHRRRLRGHALIGRPCTQNTFRTRSANSNSATNSSPATSAPTNMPSRPCWPRSAPIRCAR
jgi:glycine cleavage system H protein